MSTESTGGREYRWYKEDSDRTVRNVREAGSVEDRYDAFSEDVHKTIQSLQERLGTGSAFRYEFNQYQKQVLNELNKDKDNSFLPELALVFTKRNMSRFDSSGEGSLSASEIKAGVESKSTNRLEKAMLSALLNPYGRVNRDLQFANIDLEANGVELDAITLKDLERYAPPRSPRGETPLEQTQRERTENDRKTRLESEHKVLNMLKENEPRPGKPSVDVPALQLRESGDYLVRPKDSILSIASRSLATKGLGTTDGAAIRQEAARIVELNANHYPELARDARKLAPGMILDLSDSAVGPDSATTWKPWQATREGTVTVTTSGDSIQATGGSRVIVRNGARAVLMPGSQGFVFDGGQATALAGSEVTIAGGNVEVLPGARAKHIVQSAPPTRQRIARK